MALGGRARGPWPWQGGHGDRGPGRAGMGAFLWDSGQMGAPPASPAPATVDPDECLRLLPEPVGVSVFHQIRNHPVRWGPGGSLWPGLGKWLLGTPQHLPPGAASPWPSPEPLRPTGGAPKHVLSGRLDWVWGTTLPADGQTPASGAVSWWAGTYVAGVRTTLGSVGAAPVKVMDAGSQCIGREAGVGPWPRVLVVGELM